MATRSHFGVDARPDLEWRWRLPPLSFAAEGDGALEIETGQIDIEIGRIPVALRIPFHRGRVEAGAVGPFRLRVRPASARLRACAVRAGGTIGGEAATGEASVAGECRAEVTVRRETEHHGENGGGAP